MIKRFENGKCSIRSSVENHFPNIFWFDFTNFFFNVNPHTQKYFIDIEISSSKFRPLIIAYGI